MMKQNADLVWRKPRRLLPATALTALLALSLPLCAAVEEEDDFSLTDYASAQVRDYLSDPRRAGSLVGGILGGALTVHPAGPMLGSLIGFIIGKQTLFEGEDERRQQVGGVLRPIMPAPDSEVASLSFGGAGGQPLVTPAVADGAPSWSARTALAPSAPPPLSAIPPERLASLCRGNDTVLQPTLRKLCFYSQSY